MEVLALGAVVVASGPLGRAFRAPRALLERILSGAGREDFFTWPKEPTGSPLIQLGRELGAPGLTKPC